MAGNRENTLEWLNEMGIVIPALDASEQTEEQNYLARVMQLLGKEGRPPAKGRVSMRQDAA